MRHLVRGGSNGCGSIISRAHVTLGCGRKKDSAYGKCRHEFGPQPFFQLRVGIVVVIACKHPFIRRLQTFVQTFQTARYNEFAVIRPVLIFRKTRQLGNVTFRHIVNLFAFELRIFVCGNIRRSPSVRQNCERAVYRTHYNHYERKIDK